MASRLYYEALNQQSTEGLGDSLLRAFEGKKRKHMGVYLGRNQIQVNGQRYRFRNESGLDVAEGEALAVVNVGRLAAAEYAPASGAGSVATGGGSSGGSSTSLADHNHSGAAGSGGALAGYAPVIHTHVEAGITDLDHTQALGWIVCTNDAIVINAGEVVWQR